MSLAKRAVLHTGAKIPLIGFGTWQSEPGKVGAAVFEALKAGYRHLDLAKVYGNQREVAQGMKRAFQEVPGLKREDIFITSKLWNTQHRPEHVAAALDDCLAELELDYLDLYLMHFPAAFKATNDPNHDLFPQGSDGEIEFENGISIIDTWRAMTTLPSSKARAIGVSNFSIDYLEAIIKGTGVVPSANQVERHPLLPQPDLLKYCKSKDIHVTAYSAFGNNMFGEPLLLNHDSIKAIADRHNATPAQIILAWAQEGGHSVIPKSVTPARIVSNFNGVEISREEYDTIEKIGKTPRRYNIPYIANDPRWDVNIFKTEEEKAARNHIIVG